MLALFCCHFVVNFQGHNFGVKSGSTNSDGERGAFGSWGERGREWRASVPSSFDSGVWESVVSSPSGVRGGVPAENVLISADRFCSQQVTANSYLFIPKSGVNDLCFYSRQSLFSKVQVTEFQVWTPLTQIDTCQVNDIRKDGLSRVSTVHSTGLLHCSNLYMPPCSRSSKPAVHVAQ